MTDLERLRTLHRRVEPFRPMKPLSRPSEPYCDACDTYWPCDVWRLLDELTQSRRENAALREKLDAMRRWLRNETDRKRNPWGRGYLLHSHGCKCLSLNPEAMKHLDVGEYAHYGEGHCTCGLGQILDSLTPEPRSEETTNAD